MGIETRFFFIKIHDSQSMAQQPWSKFRENEKLQSLELMKRSSRKDCHI